jgi:hypothetical protein
MSPNLKDSPTVLVRVAFQMEHSVHGKKYESIVETTAVVKFTSFNKHFVYKPV